MLKSINNNHYELDFENYKIDKQACNSLSNLLFSDLEASDSITISCRLNVSPIYEPSNSLSINTYSTGILTKNM